MTFGVILLFLTSFGTLNMPLLQLLSYLINHFNELWSIATTAFTVGKAIILRWNSVIYWVRLVLRTVLGEARVRLIMRSTYFILALGSLYFFNTACRLFHPFCLSIRFIFTFSLGILGLCASTLISFITVIGKVASYLYPRKSSHVDTVFVATQIEPANPSHTITSAPMMVEVGDPAQSLRKRLLQTRR